MQKLTNILWYIGLVLLASCTSGQSGKSLQSNTAGPSNSNEGVAIPGFIKSDSLFVFNPDISSKTKRAMQDSAFRNTSTAPSFFVITATDSTGNTREVCTSGGLWIDDLIGNANHRKTISVKINPKGERVYYFHSSQSLKLIPFTEYDYQTLIDYGRKKEVRNIVSLVLKSDTGQSYNFQGTSKEQVMFAHILFNNGIMSNMGCYAGNIMSIQKWKN